MFYCEFEHDGGTVTIEDDNKTRLADLVEEYFRLFVYPANCKVEYNNISNAEYVEAWPISDEHGLCCFLIQEK